MFKETIARLWWPILIAALVISLPISLYLLAGTNFFIVILISVTISGVAYFLAGLLSENSMFKALASLAALSASTVILRPMLARWTLYSALMSAADFVGERTWLLTALLLSASLAIVMTVVDWLKALSGDWRGRLLTLLATFTGLLLIILLVNLLRFMTNSWALAVGGVAGLFGSIVAALLIRARRRRGFERRLYGYIRAGDGGDAADSHIGGYMGGLTPARRLAAFPLVMVACVRCFILLIFGLPVILRFDDAGRTYALGVMLLYVLLEALVIRSHVRNLTRVIQGMERFIKPSS